ncbi:MAG: xanthine dehydrogenase family protein subunit M [Candidatus Poribacteria bacterium]|nr:xanthine dehydrogenase family protein subunit M [Candidatus Poribacteria bacterium]
MKRFEYVRPASLKEAVAALNMENAHLIAGGMDLVPGMQDNVIPADRLVNLKSVKDAALRGIAETPDGLTIGALTTLTEIAEHPAVMKMYAALSQAAGVVGSPQIRNVGTLGGNLAQRPRCWYFRNEEYDCLKKGGARCFAQDDKADNQYNAILGGGPSYIVHPSNAATALVALNATIHVTGPDGDRDVAADRFFALPRMRLTQETVLDPGEIITSVTLPTPAPGSKSAFVETAEKAAFDWAISGAAVSVTMSGGSVSAARVVLHAVAPIPWRSKDAEAVLVGKSLTEATIKAAGEAALTGAKPLSKNAYKVPLTKAMVRRALVAVV